MDRNVLKSLAGKKCLVTGGTGLIGRQVVKILCDAGADVKIVSLDRIKVSEQAEHLLGDLSSFAFCKQITRDVDYVFHLAGATGSIEVTKARPATFFVPLLQMNTNVLEACRINRAQKVVYTSSIGAYANATVFKETNPEGVPMDEFPGWAKRMGELQIQGYRKEYSLNNFSIVRLCNTYGEGDNFDPQRGMVIAALMYRIYHGENPVLIWGDGSAIRDFSYSGDIAQGIVLALHYGTGPGFVNLGSGKGYSIRELVETLSSFIDFNYEFDPTKPSGYPKRVMDISLARKLIHYNPTTTLLDGLQRTWNWYLKNQDEYPNKMNYFKGGK